LQAANNLLCDARRAALNIMEDAVNARRKTELFMTSRLLL
jgi:hypothetical protein